MHEDQKVLEEFKLKALINKLGRDKVEEASFTIYKSLWDTELHEVIESGMTCEENAQSIYMQTCEKICAE